jgi:transposase
MKKTAFVGIDVSKGRLDVALRPGGRAFQATNDSLGIAQVLQTLLKVRPTLIVCEASGGLEKELAVSLAAGGLRVAVINPRQASNFGKSLGLRAKTDQIDAQMLAQFGEALRPEPRPLPNEETRTLAALLTRHRQLIAMITAESNRLALAPKAIRRWITTHLRALKTQLACIDEEIRKAVTASRRWSRKAALLSSVPGVGLVTTVTLLANLP